MKPLEINPVPNTNHIGPSDNGGLSVQLNMLMNISVVNPNIYKLIAEVIDLKAMFVPNAAALNGLVIGNTPSSQPLKVSDNMMVQIGSGTTNSSITFTPYNNITFLLGFNLDYTTQVQLDQDIAFAELLQGCGFLGTPERPMTVHYRATATVASLKSLGYRPTFEGDIHVNCPGPVGRALASYNLTNYGIKATTPPRFRSTGAAAATSTKLLTGDSMGVALSGAYLGDSIVDGPIQWWF
nr:hypothetical protein HK105_004413 [Polyrhizophydium stewartii]